MTFAAGFAAAAALTPDSANACACGCGIFDVATSSMLPMGPGGMFFTEFDYQNQYKNWSGLSTSPAAKNGDKEIRTLFITPGIQYFFNDSWGVQLEVPYDFRTFKTDTSAPGGGIAALQWGSIGDIRVEGYYTGFSPDLSSGLTFGLKLPTGNYRHNDPYGDVDRDSELGTGSTDLLLGGFHRGKISSDGIWNWFGQLQSDLPILTVDGYRPGFEFDEAVGVYYSGLSIGNVRITPIAQLIGSERMSDSGNYASGGELDGPVGVKNSGYQRLLVSPGIEFDIKRFSIYADVEVPVLQHVVGNQLTAPALFKVIFSYHF